MYIYIILRYVPNFYQLNLFLKCQKSKILIIFDKLSYLIFSFLSMDQRERNHKGLETQLLYL